MDKLYKNTLIAVSVLILVCSYLFFLRLDKPALTDPDETFYAETAREMLAKGEWVTPYLYGKPQFEKPILFYWLVEASFKAFGVNEFAARFPSAVLGTAGIIAVFFMGSILFGRRAGFLSALILATNVEYIVLSRACITDMALFVFLLAAALFFIWGYVRKAGHLYLLSSASIALAALTKGPVYLVLFAFAVLLFLFIVKDLKALGKMPLLQMAVVFAVISAPWYLAIYKLHGRAFIDGFFGLHNVNRFLVSEHKIGSQFYYNIPIIMGGFFPWSVFLPAGFLHAIGKLRVKSSESGVRNIAEDTGRKGSIFVLVWFAVIFGFFTVSSTKLPTYIFPLFISSAVIVGALLDDFLKGEIAGSVMRFTIGSFYLLAAVMIVGWSGAALYAKLDFPSILPGVVISSLVLALGGLLSLIAFINKKFEPAFGLIALSVAAFLMPLGALILPEVERYETSKEVSMKLLSVMKQDERLGSESNYLAGLAFYTGRFPANLDDHHLQIAFFNSKERIWAVIKEKNHRHIYDPEITKEYVKPSYMVSVTGKRALVTNEIPEDGRFMVKRETVR
ncbi:MAG: glycosyltransferase family 39 protein [Candidatus Omnitrophota bacterium]